MVNLPTLTLSSMEKLPDVSETPIAVEAPLASKAMFKICTVVVATKRLLVRLVGRIITDVDESPSKETPPAVMMRGLPLLFSRYIPEAVRIATGFERVDKEFARPTALARLAKGAVNDPSPVVSLPYFVT